MTLKHNSSPWCRLAAPRASDEHLSGEHCSCWSALILGSLWSPPFTKVLPSPGGHYRAPDFILVLNITNKRGFSVIKQHWTGLLDSVMVGGLIQDRQHTSPLSVYFTPFTEKHEDIFTSLIFSAHVSRPAACWSKPRNTSDSGVQSFSLSICITLAWFASL